MSFKVLNHGFHWEPQCRWDQPLAATSKERSYTGWPALAYHAAPGHGRVLRCTAHAEEAVPQGHGRDGSRKGMCIRDGTDIALPAFENVALGRFVDSVTRSLHGKSSLSPVVTCILRDLHTLMFSQ